MSTIDERPALIAWVRAALKQLDETSGDQPWKDAAPEGGESSEETGR